MTDHASARTCPCVVCSIDRIVNRICGVGIVILGVESAARSFGADFLAFAIGLGLIAIGSWLASRPR